MKQIILNLAATLLMIVPIVGLTGSVYAATPAPAPTPSCGTPSDAKTQVLNGIGQTGGNCDDSGIINVIKAIVSILSLVVGITAVIMIVLSGFKYVTSGGDSGKVGNAKGTLIYALIGLVVAALAQIIVHYVLTVANNQCPSDASISVNDPRCSISK